MSEFFLVSQIEVNLRDTVVLIILLWQYITKICQYIMNYKFLWVESLQNSKTKSLQNSKTK